MVKIFFDQAMGVG